METSELRDRLIILERQNADFRFKEKLNHEVDELIEQALKKRLCLKDTLDLVCPRVIDMLNAEALYLKTFSEDLEFNEFCWYRKDGELSAFPHQIADLDERARYNTEVVECDEKYTVLAYRLDVAGDFFGSTGMVFNRKMSDEEIRLTMERINVFCEKLDNYLASIATSRAKQNIIVSVTECLKHRVLERGIDEAMEIIKENIHFEKCVIIFHEPNDISGRSIKHRIYTGSEADPAHTNRIDREIKQIIDFNTKIFLNGQDVLSSTKLGMRGQFREEVLIHGVVEKKQVGKILISSNRASFNTFNLDLLERFANSIRQRVVDFNKEQRSLAQFFCRDHIGRLLAENRYQEKYLHPRVQDSAIMYVDLCSFTKISEQILSLPEEIGCLVDTWSKECVNIIWENRGVFDKMVGDCLIALFGPPFWDNTNESYCQRAVDTALGINKATEKLLDRAEFKKIKESPLVPGLAISGGVNFAPLNCGIFGPHREYTGFSSGMNNTARLQGIANFAEVLVMESMVPILEPLDKYIFGPIQKTLTKNVRDPLEYRSVKWKQ
ncbi:MAG: adenylate/guanylate cyclase domain-containing protein [Proteobacteria bacterium]|nr:adenylate/guanylate cyclase domain-containing protein [Pseudomonadota bacterium]